MIVPLQVLAVGSILAGLLRHPGRDRPLPARAATSFEHFLEPVFEPAHHAARGGLRGGRCPAHGVELGAHGRERRHRRLRRHPAGAALLPDAIPRSPSGSPPRSRASTALLLNKYYVDEIYGAVFVRGLALGGGRVLHGDRPLRRGRRGRRGAAGPRRERHRLDRPATSWPGSRTSGTATSWTAAVNVTAVILDNLSYVFRAVQNGLVQHYALAMLIGVFLLIVARPLPPRALLEGVKKWTSSAITCSRSSPTRRSWARSSCCCPVFKKNDDAVRWVANVVRAPRLPGQPAPLVLVRPRQGRLPVRGEGRVDPVHRRLLPLRRGRHQRAPHPAHHPAGRDRDPRPPGPRSRTACGSTTSSCSCCRRGCSASSARSTCSSSTCSGRSCSFPMYFLIGIWGGARRLYAAIKFFLYTLVGSVVMLLGHPGPLLPLARSCPASSRRAPST